MSGENDLFLQQGSIVTSYLTFIIFPCHRFVLIKEPFSKKREF